MRRLSRCGWCGAEEATWLACGADTALVAWAPLHQAYLQCAKLSCTLRLTPNPLMPLQTNKRVIPYLFVRGDGVILISPPLRS